MNVIPLHGRPRRQKQTPAFHTNYVGLAVSDELLVKLEHAAWAQKITRSEFIRRALETHLAGVKK